MNNEYYIYIIENDAGYIKIGITKDFDQRRRALSGSNGGGHKIVRTFVSEGTNLYTLERIMHNKYDRYRISGTEWFDFTESDIRFDDVCDALNQLMTGPRYELCNKLRDSVERGDLFETT